MNKMVYLIKEVVKILYRQHHVAKRKLIDWETKNESKHCKHCKNVLILTEKASQRAVLAAELAFKCANDKCKSHHKK